MATYRNFYINFWDDDDILDLNADERYIYLYLITNPKGTISGVFELSLKLAEFHTKISSLRITKAIDGLQKHGKVAFDENSKEVCIINWLKHNYIDSPNTRKALEASLKSIKSPTISHFIRGLPGALEGLAGASKPYVKERDIEDANESPFVSLEKQQKELEGREPIDFNEIINRWNNITELPHIVNIFHDREKMTRARIKESGINGLYKMIENVKVSPFLLGKSKAKNGFKPFKATYDWCIHPNNFTKVLDGNYLQEAQAEVPWLADYIKNIEKGA